MTNRTNWMAAAGSVLALALAQSASAQTVTTDSSTYNTGDLLTATWADIPAGLESFIAIARPQDPDDVYLYWQSIALAANGDTVFDHLPAGTRFEMRVYGDYSLNVVARSAEFSVGNGATTLDADKSVYNPGENMVFTWTNGPGYFYDWLGVALDGTAPEAYVAYVYTDGDYDGSRTWNDMTYTAGVSVLPPFCFDVRYYVNDQYDVAASDDFCVELPPGSPTITTDAAEYTPSTPVDVCWNDAPGNALDWVGIAKRALSPVELYSYTDIDGSPLWRYLNGVVDGCLSTDSAEGVFAGDKILGNYAARGFADDTYLAFANQALFVVNFADGGFPTNVATLTTDKSTYFVGEPVMVTYNGLPGNEHDVIALATDDFDVVPGGGGASTANDPIRHLVDWSYMRGSTAGTETFYTVLEPGTYSAWGFENDQYTVAGQSSTFDVVLDESKAPHIWSVPTCITPGTPEVLIGYENLDLGADAWVGIFNYGDPADAFSLVWSWIGGSTEGEGVFPVDHLAEGTYEIRVLTDDREIGATSIRVVSAECPTPSVTRDRDFYQVGDTITADFSDFNGHADEMVGYQQTGLDPAVDPYEAQASTGGALAGSVEFTASTPGTYVMRGFMEWSKFVEAESAEFIICPVGQVPDCNGICVSDTLIDPFECVDTGADSAP